MNILLSFAGDKTDMVEYFKKAVGNTGKVFANDYALKYALTQADGYFIISHECNNDYISVLTDYCKKNNISAIIPLSDFDLPVLSKNKQKLKSIGITATVSDEEAVEICIDRWKTYLFLKSINVNHPKSYIDLESVKKDINEKTLTFPLIMKPRIASKKFMEIYIETLEELELFYRKLKQNISKTSNFNEDKNIIIQENISGDEYAICLLNDLQGNFVTAVSLKKLQASNIKTYIAPIVDNKPFENLLKLFSSELKFISCIEINLCLNQAEDIIVTEINARFGKDYTFWQFAGTDFPKQIVDWLTGKPVSLENIYPVIGVKGSKDGVLPVIFNC